ncbi:MAG: hypothetical protein ACRD2C_18670 [Acidimicrobiales bacterium]
MSASGNDEPQPVEPLDVDDLRVAAREMAAERVEQHKRTRTELTSHLRRIREEQAVIASRRDEAAARARRLAAHLNESEGLLEQSAELATAADAAQRELDGRRGDLEAARDRLALVEDQRVAAARAIDDAQSQLHDLESAELDEASLRRELEKSGRELHDAEAALAQATAAVEALQSRAGERAASRDQLAHQRAAMVERIEAPIYDPQPVQAALAALDAETAPEGDLVAHDLAREWAEVDDELARIEAALPQPPSENDLTTAEHNLSELENVIAELEATNQHARLPMPVRDQIDAAHEAVLAAEEYLDQSGGHPMADAQLEAARVAEQQILASYGYETYLDLVMAEPEPAEAQSELLDVMRARRHAEDTLASLWASTEPPQIVLTLRARRERIFREAAELLCCDPGENITDLLYAHPVVPPNRVRDLANALASYGVYPVGVSVRDATIQFLMDLEEEAAVRDQYYGEIERLDEEAMVLDEDEATEGDEAHRLYDMVHLTADGVEAANERVQTLERELIDRTAQDERRLQRVAAAEQLRAQIAAVTEALERSENEYHDGIAQADAAATAAEANLERATAALSDAVRKLRRISEALPPALRPKSSDDPLAELPRLREALGSEVERAEVALTNATQDLERARADIDTTQADLDAHLTVTPSAEVEPDDVYAAVSHLLGTDAEQIAVLDDPFDELGDDQRMDLLDALVASAAYRPVVLLTDHLDTLGWAISLPDDAGMVTGLPPEPLAEAPVAVASGLPLPDPSEVVAPSPSSS